MRVAVLWTGLSGYLNACLRELASRPGVELFVAHSEPNSQAPYDVGQLSWMKNEVMWRGAEDFARLQSSLAAFNPQVVVVAGWHVPLYRRIMKSLKGRCLRIMTMDNRWSGTTKQWLGSFVASFHVLPYADAAWVPAITRQISPASSDSLSRISSTAPFPVNNRHFRRSTKKESVTSRLCRRPSSSWDA